MARRKMSDILREQMAKSTPKAKSTMSEEDRKLAAGCTVFFLCFGLVAFSVLVTHYGIVPLVDSENNYDNDFGAPGIYVCGSLIIFVFTLGLISLAMGK